MFQIDDADYLKFMPILWHKQYFSDNITYKKRTHTHTHTQREEDNLDKQKLKSNHQSHFEGKQLNKQSPPTTFISTTLTHLYCI